MIVKVRAYMTGMFAKSLAGHDKNEIYYIIEESKESVLLVDGIYKTISKPKKKNKKHVQIIKTQISEIDDMKGLLGGNNQIGDLEIKRAIKLLKMRKMEE